MSGGGSNTVSQNTVPEWLQPYLTQTLSSAQSLENSGGPQYYPGQQVAGLTPMQNQGFADVQQQASGSNASDAAQAMNEKIQSGAFLDPSTNPYLTGTYNTAAQQVQNSVASQFAGAGRNIIGSAPVQSSAMDQLANEIYGGAYNTGMQQIVQSSGLSPTIDAGTYSPAQALLAAGTTQQQQGQNEINANMNAYNYQQQLPENMLTWYASLMNQSANPFSGQSSSTSGGNPALQYAGLGLGVAGAGASLYSALTAAAPAVAAA